MRNMSLDEAVDFLLDRVEGPIRIGTPLGLGKPNPFLNRLYERMRPDSSRGLEFYTALSLDPPRVKGLLAENFFGPFAERQFGPNYPRLSYVNDVLKNKLPDHIRVYEFFVQAGLYKNNPRAQADYVSLNYTHVVANLVERGVNCIAQLVARGPDGRLSLSCNPDLTLDLVDQSAAKGRTLVKIAVVHEGLPFLGGPAAVPADYFDLILEGPEHAQELFAIPRMPFEVSDHLIGLHASQLPVDDGTLQIGIGALAEALSYSLILRHERNALYRQLVGRLPSNPMGPPISHEPFRAGLYGMSEMVMDSFMHLRKAGILTREVQNKKSPHPRYLHGGFFLGSKPFYAWLKGLSEKDRRGISMTRISKINDLYDEDEAAVRAQRKNARFFNSTMQVSLLGEALSDTLQDGRVISGVGGQYNFVAMSRELPDAYSTLLLRSTWHDGKRRRSNIVMHGGHVT
ncbi:MAG: acetyl-CoA hydrolase, partial [Proteobacteria bacterium]